jgi:hypothetical protein
LPIVVVIIAENQKRIPPAILGRVMGVMMLYAFGMDGLTRREFRDFRCGEPLSVLY